MPTSYRTSKRLARLVALSRLTRGVVLSFPQNVTRPTGGTLLLVNFDPALELATLANLRSLYNLSASVSLYGPYNGHLANAEETLGLYKPDPPQLPSHPVAGFVPYVLVDQIDYVNDAPWSSGASGHGFFTSAQCSFQLW